MQNPYQLIKKQVPSFAFETIFDVGANKGDTVLISRNAFPNSAIYAFEPVPNVYAQLEAVTQGKNININRVAVGRQSGMVEIEMGNDPTMNKIQTTGEGNLVNVPMTTIDDFCGKHSVSNIDFLKIDTEGFDLEVILGAKNMLKSISFIQCEVSANPHNKYHVDFRLVYDYLVDFNNFYLFQILDQVSEWGGKPVLRRFDAVFINGKHTW